jgi:hypothetical protein
VITKNSLQKIATFEKPVTLHEEALYQMVSSLQLEKLLAQKTTYVKWKQGFVLMESYKVLSALSHVSENIQRL